MENDRVELESVVGAKIRSLREARGWSQTELGDRMGRIGTRMQQSTIAKLEAGARPIRVNELDALARVFEVRVPSLVDFVDGSEVHRASDVLSDAVGRVEWARHDVIEAEAELARARARLEAADTDLQQARAVYRSLWSGGAGGSTVMTGQQAKSWLTKETGGEPGEEA